MKRGLKGKKQNVGGMPQVALEDMVTWVIVAFVENAAELGWNWEMSPLAAWYKCLTKKQRFELAGKLLDIMGEAGNSGLK